MRVFAAICVLLAAVAVCGFQLPCPDGNQVNCFASPCSVSGDKCPNGCVDDYCGGCNARCTCSKDADCAADQFCRVTPDESVSACTPFAQQGEECGGFVPSYAERRCAPSDVCVNFPSEITDQPGVCTKGCSSDPNACGSDAYCTGRGAASACLPHGSCALDSDCYVPTNSWVHIACAGSARCLPGGTCEWTCA